MQTLSATEYETTDSHGFTRLRQGYGVADTDKKTTDPPATLCVALRAGYTDTHRFVFWGWLMSVRGFRAGGAVQLREAFGPSRVYCLAPGKPGASVCVIRLRPAYAGLRRDRAGAVSGGKRISRW